jgi:hypothetical protein
VNDTWIHDLLCNVRRFLRTLQKRRIIIDEWVNFLRTSCRKVHRRVGGSKLKHFVYLFISYYIIHKSFFIINLHYTLFFSQFRYFKFFHLFFASMFKIFVLFQSSDHTWWKMFSVLRDTRWIEVSFYVKVSWVNIRAVSYLIILKFPYTFTTFAH